MIGIVGAGVTGLALGHHLATLGVDHVIFEASSRVGGVVRTVVRGSQPLELGPQRTRLTDSVRALVDELGLAPELITARPGLPLFVYARGRLRRVPFTPREAIGSDVISWRAKARLLVEPLTNGPSDGETVKDYFVRKLGRETYETVVGPLYGGLYASDPGRMMVRHQLAGVLARLGPGTSLIGAWSRAGAAAGRTPACSFREGMQALPEALRSANAGRIRLSTPVRRISDDGLRGLRVELGREVVPVRAVVLTAPAAACAEILEDRAPDMARRLLGLTYNPLALVHLESDAPLEGFGYQVAFGETLETRGVTWNASLFGRDRVYTAFLGGQKNPGLVELPAARLGEIAADEFRKVTGYGATPVHVHRTRVPAWDVSWRGLDGATLPPGIRICSNFLGRPGVPGRLEEARKLAVELAREEGVRVS